ncbi:hypothetical protein ABZP36_030564 [Zizania latifolia]
MRGLLGDAPGGSPAPVPPRRPIRSPGSGWRCLPPPPEAATPGRGVCMMSTSWRDKQQPSLINFIAAFLAANSYRLNFLSISPDFIFNNGGLSVAFVFETNWDRQNEDAVFSRVNRLKRQFKNLYVVVAVPTGEQNKSFNQSYHKYDIELGCPTFVPVNDPEMGFEKIAKIAHARGVCKQQDIISTMKNEREQAVQCMDAFLRVLTSIPGIDNHDANALAQAVGSIEAIAKASKGFILENTDLSRDKAETVVRGELPHVVYRQFVSLILEIGTERNMSIEKCEEMVPKILDGHPRVIEAFQHFIQGRSPLQDNQIQHTLAVKFLRKVKECPDISTDDHDALLKTLIDFNNKAIVRGYALQKAREFIRNSPQLLQEFEAYTTGGQRDPLPKETALSFTPDANNRSDGIQVKATNGRKEVPQLKYTLDQNHDGTEHSLRQKQTKRICARIRNPRKGNHKAHHLEDDEENKAEPLLQWSPSRENELPPIVDLSNSKHCTPSYRLLPKNCMTLESSCQSELEKSVLNDSLVSVPSGTEDSFKFITKNQYEENMFKCEDDLFESDMLLQRYRAIVRFIEGLQNDLGRQGSNVKIEERLTPLHRRCIEHLYGDYSLDMLDALSESENASVALAVILSRLNQKIQDLSDARLSLHKMCSDTIANNYYRSLDHCSSSFKQLDTKRISPKALLAEDKRTNETKSRTDIHIHEDIASIINYAYSRSSTTEDKPMMNWTELVKALLSVEFQWPCLEATVSLRKNCEHCGIDKDFPSSILDDVLTNELVLSSKRVESLRDKSNESTSLHDSIYAEVEEGEFIPDLENIQLPIRCSATNTSGHSNHSYRDESEEQYESRDGSSNEVGSSAYFGTTVEARDVSCCSLAVLSRLLQIMYERLLVAKQLSKESSTKFLLRQSCTRDSYAEFKEKLCNLIDGSIDTLDFEQHCLKFLGPKSYILFTLDKLIDHAIKKIHSVFLQICRIYPSREDSLVLQQQEKSRRINLSKESLHQQNARDRDREEPKDGEQTGKVIQNHFQRRKKRMLENGTTTFSHH